jgi:hypothetical protein
MLQQAQAQIIEIAQTPTIEQVLKFVQNNRAKSFVLDIETDSTIMADENAEKQRRAEFIQVLGQLLPQLSSMISAEPKTAKFCGELLKFATAPFRAGRSLDGTIDELVQQMEGRSNQQRPDPETEKTKALVGIEQQKLKQQADKDKADIDLKNKELMQKDNHEKLKLQNDREMKAMELRAKAQDDQAKAQQTNQKAMADREKHQADMVGKQVDVEIAREKMDIAQQQSALKRQDMASRQQERQAMQQFKINQQGMLPPGS